MQADGAEEMGPGRHRIFRFGDAEFDEGALELRVDGERRPLEAKPRRLLEALLSQPNMVVSKRDLTRAVWPEKTFVDEGSLATAVYKLRAALGPRGRDVIKAAPGVGYQIPIAVEIEVTEAAPLSPLTLQAGQPVPGRRQWRLERPLHLLTDKDVWLARNEKTPELRVFKFARTAERLDALKREAALSRILQAKLGGRDDVIPIFEWNFESAPYFVELPYGGLNLSAWLAGRVGPPAPDLAARLALVAQVARTVADAHGAGVLHGDLKPANILVDPSSDGPPRPRLTDFGAGGLTESARLELLNLTLEAPAARDSNSAVGTFLYLAPERLNGGPPSIAGDVYALGILLHQMVVGDLDRPLAAGWEQGVACELLRQDIADAAAGDPARRLVSAALLAERLQTLEARRSALAKQRAHAVAAERLTERLRRARMQRPWIVLLAVVLMAGLVAVGIAALRERQAREEAERQARIAHAVNLFVTDDLLGLGNPANAGKANETLMEAATTAETRIASRFSSEPLVAASLYLSLARAFDSLSAYGEARIAYARAITAFETAQGPGSPDAVIVRLRLAQIEVLASEAGSLERARALVASAATRMEGLGRRSAEARVWLLAAKATLQLTGGDMPAARDEFKAAADLADTMPETFDIGGRLALRQRQAYALFRLGRWNDADALLHDLLRRQIALHGPDHPDTLQVRLTLAQVLMGRGEASAAVAALDDLYPGLVRVFGKDHRLVLQALTARARSLGRLGRYDDAVRDDMEVYRMTVAKQGVESQYAITPLSDIAESQCRAGRAKAGLENANLAYKIALKTYPKLPTIPQAISTEVAFCLIIDGKNAAAEEILKGIDRKAMSQLIADPNVDAGIDLMLANTAAATGDAARARALLAAPRKAYDRDGADPYMRRWVQRLAAATIYGAG
jgi:DNA-binding winged helix-turn-helix (wHTH) protein